MRQYAGSVWRRGRRRGLPVLVAAGLVAGLVPAGAVPAGADPAPLVTEDGVGIRVDETALTGPALDAIEDSLQPFVDDMILDGATGDGAPFPSHNFVEVSSDLQLDLDFVPPGDGRPDGGLEVNATIGDIEIHYGMTGLFWLDCSIRAQPDDGTIAIGASVDRAALPGTPISLDPVQATWDDDPNVDWDWPCAGHVVWQAITQWWDGLWDSSDPESTAARIERELNDTAQELIDDLWDDQVAPVLDSLDAFGLSINQLRTDDHGLIVTADLDATDLTLPEIGGPFDVSDAQDSGVDTDVNDLLAQRTNQAGDSHAIVTVHPNVVNQFVYAIDDMINGFLGQRLVSSDIQEVLLDPAVWDDYEDEGWVVRLLTEVPGHTEPTGPGGQPQLQLPDMRLEVFNVAFSSFDPIAVFEGELDAIDLVTEVRDDGVSWGPGLSAEGIAGSLTLTDANDDVLAWDPDPADVVPFASTAIDEFNDFVFVDFLSLAPIAIGDMSVDLCPISTCGRYPGDERYTETFLVN